MVRPVRRFVSIRQCGNSDQLRPETGPQFTCRRKHDILTSPEPFSDNDRKIANVTALLHDIGRFEQFRNYQTFLDLNSVNHAELGLSILEREQVLNALSTDERECIISGIRYHNRATLPSDLP